MGKGNNYAKGKVGKLDDELQHIAAAAAAAAIQQHLAWQEDAWAEDVSWQDSSHIGSNAWAGSSSDTQAGHQAWHLCQCCGHSCYLTVVS